MKRLLMAGALVLLTSAPGSAAIIDFTSLPAGNNPNPLALPGATFTTAAGFNYIASGALCPSISSLNAFDCSNSLEVAFDTPSTGLSFTFFANNLKTPGADIGDVHIFSGATLLGTINILVVDTDSFTRDLVSLAAFSDVTRLMISSTDFGGILYDDFSFEQSVPAPEPATLTLVALGLLATGARRRQRRRAGA